MTNSHLLPIDKHKNIWIHPRTDLAKENRAKDKMHIFFEKNILVDNFVKGPSL